MQNLLDFDSQSLQALMIHYGEKPFRAKQLLRWIHHFGIADFAQMTDISASFRDKLKRETTIKAPLLLTEKKSQDGTYKWLLDVGVGNGIETVFIPEAERGTLCISSQVGCALSCAFCSTARQGFNRNLSVAEIIGQLWWANKALGRDPAGDRIISNVVMMGMGEPLANFTAVVSALRLMLDDHAYGLSRRRVTLSTSGLVPAIDKLRDSCPVALAISLHAPNDTLRDHLVPINKKYPLSLLMAACQRYLEKAPRDFITFEYVMLDGVNDSIVHARSLTKLVKDVPCKINLIPFNNFANSGYRCSTRETIIQFRNILAEAGYTVTIRKTRGEDIDAACGQLAGKVYDKTGRSQNKDSSRVSE